jgi:tetratricopeptide (TPR) repeat protein
LEEALAGLHRYGLVEVPDPAVTGAAPTLALHPLVREVSDLLLKGEAPDLGPWRRTRGAVAQRLVEVIGETVAAGRDGWMTARLLAAHAALLGKLIDTDPGQLSNARSSVKSLADSLHAAGDYGPEIDLLQIVLAEQEQHGPDHPDTLASRNNLGEALHGLGRHAEAADLHRETLDASVRVLGPDHPDTLTSRNNLAGALYGLGRHAEAADLHRETLDAYVRVLGPDHPDTLTSRNNLANALDGLGRHAEAADLHRETLDARVRVLGPDHPDTLGSRNSLAVALARVSGRKRRQAWATRAAIVCVVFVLLLAALRWYR